MTSIKTYFKKDIAKYKKKKRGVSYAKLKKVYEIVLKRDGMRCQNPNCKSGFPFDDPHHVQKRSQCGKDVQGNLILLCCECHRLIHHEGKLKITGVYPDFVFMDL